LCLHCSSVDPPSLDSCPSAQLKPICLFTTMATVGAYHGASSGAGWISIRTGSSSSTQGLDINLTSPGSNLPVRVDINLTWPDPTYLAGSTSTLPGQDQTYLAGSTSTLSGRDQPYLAGSTSTLPSRDQTYLAGSASTLPGRDQPYLAGSTSTLPRLDQTYLAGSASTLPGRDQTYLTGSTSTLPGRVDIKLTWPGQHQPYPAGLASTQLEPAQFLINENICSVTIMPLSIHHICFCTTLNFITSNNTRGLAPFSTYFAFPPGSSVSTRG
jgi:hypothetical protein